VTAIIVHGGAGRLVDGIGHQRGIRAALRAGYDALRRTRSALEGALSAVRVMEDDPAFNCGTGSALTINGRAMMDASVMTSGGNYGAVGAIESVRHPIDVAVRVMNDTDHYLIAGEWATKLARFWGFPKYNPVTRREQERLAKLKRGSKLSYYTHWHRFEKFGTVGAVALDSHGRIAVATSTGGIRGKLPGRIGDTGIYGAGTYAGRAGGASATGFGEEIIELLLAKRVCDLMARFSAQRAVDAVIRGTHKVGVICLDRKGNIGCGHSTRDMSWGYVRNREERVFEP
jgi:beta-aspartyl-peptidase (threonine type)